MMSEKSEDITLLLKGVEEGNPEALEKLIPVVYYEIKNLARSALKKERPCHTLQATALVHELFMRLVKRKDACWENRTHFYKAASMALNWILIDYARHRTRKGKPGKEAAVSSDPNYEPTDFRVYSKKIEILDIALKRLETKKNMERKCQIVNMHFFMGMTYPEIAERLKIATITVKKDWQFAKAWLLREMKEIESYGV